MLTYCLLGVPPMAPDLFPLLQDRSHPPASPRMSFDPAALVRRLRSGSRVTQLQALRSLATLANTSPEHNHVVLASGAVAAILQLRELNSGGAVQDAAAHALRTLSQTLCPTTLATFVGADAIPPLVRLLRSSLSSSVATLQLSAAAALWNLASHDGGAAAVAAAGAVPPLVEVLLARTGQHLAEVDSAAAGALNAVIQAGQELAWDVVRLGGVPALLGLIERRTTAGTARRWEEQTIEYTANALASLAEYGGECQAAVVAAGVVPRLAALLSHSCSTVQGACADALRAALLRSAAAKVAFAEARAAPAAVGLLRSPHRDVQQQAAGVLGNAAAYNAACCADILAAGAVQPLVQLLRTPGHPARAWAAITVQNLCTMRKEAAGAAFRLQGADHALMTIAGSSDDRHERKAAKKALGALNRAMEAAAKRQAGSAGSASGAGAPGSTAAASSSAASAPAVQPPSSPARVCSAPGCGATHGLKRCGGCGAVRYCSAECSRAHWREHRVECRRLQAERAPAAAAAEGGEEPVA